jgi:hypothetical protein
MPIQDPYKIYTADNNIEAILLVEMLQAAGIEAFVDEDQFWALGTLTQLHRSNVWIEKSTASKAADLIARFEERKWQRTHPTGDAAPIPVHCEECGKVSAFPANLRGTTQECFHCGAYVDVGESDWDTDADDPESGGST